MTCWGGCEGEGRDRTTWEGTRRSRKHIYVQKTGEGRLERRQNHTSSGDEPQNENSNRADVVKLAACRTKRKTDKASGEKEGTVRGGEGKRTVSQPFLGVAGLVADGTGSEARQRA